jgi:hypothetical protein
MGWLLLMLVVVDVELGDGEMVGGGKAMWCVLKGLVFSMVFAYELLMMCIDNLVIIRATFDVTFLSDGIG